MSKNSDTNPNHCLSFIAFSFATRGTKEKALQKENAVFCANAARATAFEKAVQNNRLVCVNIVTDKSKFEVYTRNKKSATRLCRTLKF